MPLSAVITGQQIYSKGNMSKAGICIPLASIWSERSLGIGEFPDLMALIPWLAETGFSILQLLPLTDSGSDPSPYSAICTNALNYAHLSLRQLPHLEKLPHLRETLDTWTLSDGLWVDYAAVRTQKARWLEAYLEAMGTHIAEEPQFKSWCVDNQDWLEEYALFLRGQHLYQSYNWEHWPESIESIRSNCPQVWLRDVYIVQYLCWQQLIAVKSCADQYGIELLGDLPILVARHSADVWGQRELFDLNYSVGAPPDFFSPDGQLWGFPLYNWSNHVATHFNWWKRRLQLAEQYYHRYRLDHVLGFFRFWAIAPGHSALEGFFIPGDAAAWLPQGKAILDVLLGASKMLPLAEDLGVQVPGICDLLANLEIPGIRVMRWTRHWDTDGRFFNGSEYPYWSMACLSTHDSSMIGGWWSEEPEGARRFCEQQGWLYYQPLDQKTRRELLLWLHQTTSCLHINLLQEYMALFKDLIPDELADRRINTPGMILPVNWTMRLTSSVEQIIAHAQLKQLMSECANYSALATDRST